MWKLFTLLFILAAFVCPAQQSGNDDEVRFVVLGDTQFNFPEVFERMVHEVDLLRPDLVIQVGDLIHGYNNDVSQLRDEWKRFKYQINPLSVPFYPVPGNHDVITPESEKVYGEIWGTDRYWYSFDDGPVHFVVLDNYWQDEDDTVGVEQREWLKNDLEEYAEANGGVGSEELEQKSIFVFMHAPLFRYGGDHPGAQVWNEIHKMLQMYPVRMVFAGHSHEYVWENRDGIDYVVLNSSGYMHQKHVRAGMYHEFLHVSVENGNDVRTAVVQAGSVLPVDTVTSEERRQNPRYLIGKKSLRVPDFEDGKASLAVTVSNPLDKERAYYLHWMAPQDSAIAIEPATKWISVPAKESVDVLFDLSAEGELDRNKLPALEVKATEKLRAGYVPQEWEEVYRDEIEQAKNDPGVRTTNVPLDEEFEFVQEWPLFLPPRVTAPHISTEISIDGMLNEEVWQSAGIVDDFTIGHGEKGDTATAVRLLYDERFLYVGAHMEEPNPEGLKANAGGDIAMTWADDDLELFIDPGMTQRRFYRIFENSAGTRFSSKPIGSPENLYKPEYESGIEIGEDYWNLEMAIPWSDLGAEAPTAGDEWGLNIWRHRQQSFDARQQWSEMRIFPYEAEKFGVLQFGE